jgi:polyphosphate kinase
MSKPKRPYHNREISWLSFNARVLQEAEDTGVPLVERIRFLGIFSSNLDEFFRVRVATLKRACKLGKKAEKILGNDPREILEEIHAIVLKLFAKFATIYQSLLQELAAKDIYIINEREALPVHKQFIENYFHQQVQPTLVPIMLNYIRNFSGLKDQSIYLAVHLAQHEKGKKTKYALIEVPTAVLPRFVLLPPQGSRKYIMLLDDVIRYCLPEIFAIFRFDACAAYCIKLTRDAELDIENDAMESYIEKISRSVKNRKKGKPVRFTYDASIAPEFLEFLAKKFHITQRDNLIPGGRYHNFKDFINFPDVGLSELRYHPRQTLPRPELHQHKRLLVAIRKHDIMLHYPYQSFDYMISLLREAAIDPKVVSIKMTLYRLAKNSNVVNALIHAVRNGTQVTVVVELQARFDEEANIYWAHKLEEEGAKVIYGVPGYKVHSKLCLITRKEDGRLVDYANISTGNYNELTARLYCDDSLLTADVRITKEVREMFNFFEDNIYLGKYKHLAVSPFHMRSKFVKLIQNEIQNARKGREAFIILKLNSLVDRDIIAKLYEANNAGVKIRLIIRGSCAVIPGIQGVSENIEALSIIDRFLEHARILLFCNGGEELYFISSADWMNRNLNHRIEVACPIYSKEIQRELRTMLDIQFQDNVKARWLNEKQDNAYKKTPTSPQVRSQSDIYQFFQGEMT